MAEQAGELSTVLTDQEIKNLQRQSRRENLGRAWFKFSRNPLSIVGGVTVLIVLLLAIFAPYVTPYPEHAQSLSPTSTMLVNHRVGSTPLVRTCRAGTYSPS